MARPALTVTVDPKAIAAQVRSRLEAAMTRLDIAAIAPAFLYRMEKFAELLARWGAKMNLTAHPEDPEETAFHIIDCLAPLALESEPEGYHLKESFAHGRRVLDVGSGAGFPGLVLASASDARFTLCEARRKRVTFLNVAIAEMGLTNVTVEPKYLSPADLDGDFDLVTSRALGPPAEFYRIAAAALLKDGIAILYANPAQRLDVADAHSAGLGAEIRVPYELRRGKTIVKRVLMLWRKL